MSSGHGPGQSRGAQDPDTTCLLCSGGHLHPLPDSMQKLTPDTTSVGTITLSGLDCDKSLLAGLPASTLVPGWSVLYSQPEGSF